MEERCPSRRKSSSPGKYRKGKERKVKDRDREKEEKGKEKEKEEKKEKEKEKEMDDGKRNEEKKKVRTVFRVASGENRLRFDMVPRCPTGNDNHNPLTAREKGPNDDEGKCLIRSKSLYFSLDTPPPDFKVGVFFQKSQVPKQISLWALP